MAIEKISIDIRSNAKEVEKELAKINSQIKKLEKEKINIRLDTKKLDAAEKKLDKLNTKLSGLSVQKAIIEVDTGDINEAVNALGRLHNNIQQLSSIQIQTDISIRLSDVDLNMENIGSELQDQGLKLIKNITAVIEEGAAALQTASDKLPADIDSIIPKLTAMGAAIVGMGVLVGAAGAAATEFPKEAKTGFKMIREIGKLLIESAEVMDEISGKLPSDFGDFGSKLDGMNLAIAAMSVLVAAAGAAATEFPKEAKTGFKMIREIGKVLVESAEVIEEISGKLPSDFGEVAAKMTSMGIAIGGMGLLAGIAGAAATEFPKEAKTGFKMIREIGKALVESAEVIEEISGRLPSDFGDVAAKMTSMGIAIGGMGLLAGIAGAAATKFPKEAKAGFKTISEISKVMIESAEALGEVATKVPSNFGEVASKMASMGIAIGGMGLLVGIAGKAAIEFPKEAKEGFSKILDINIVLQETAETMEQIAQKIPSNLGEMSSRLASMGIAILGMGALVGIAGKLATEFPEEAKEGLGKILDINIVLQETAETMEQIAQKIPSDLGEMSSRLASMGIAILGMGALVGIAGKLATEFPEEAKEGLSKILDINIVLQETAETMGQIAQKIPSDLGAMSSRLASMGIAILGMGILVGIAGAFAKKAPEEAKAGLDMILDINILLQETAETMGQIAQKIPSDLGAMSSRLASMGIAILGMGVLVGIAGAFAKKAPEEAKAGLDMILDINILLQETAETMGQIAQKIPSDLGAMSSRLASMGIAILGMGALVVIAGAVNKKFSKETKAGLAMISEVNVLLLDAANALGEINKKVPSNLETMASKLASMGIAIGGMSALVLIVGKFSESNPAAAVAGLFVVDEVIGLLMESAEAMKQIDKKVPGNIDKVAEKLANIGIAIGGMSVLVGVVGALVASGIGALIAGAGLATIYLVAEELIHISEAIKEMDQNVPEDMTGVKEKIEGIAEAVGYFTAADLGGVLDLLENAVGALNTAVAAEGIKKLVEVGLELEKLDGITIPEGVEQKINDIQAVFEYLKKGVGLLGEIDQFFNGGGIDTKTGGKASQAIENLVSVVKSITALDKYELKEPSVVKTKIDNIQAVFGYLTKTKGWFDDIKRAFGGNNIDTGVAKDAKTYIESIRDIAETFEKLQTKDLKTKKISSMIENIQEVFDSFLGKGNLAERFASMFTGEKSIDNTTVSSAKTYVTNLATVAAELQKIQNTDLNFSTVRSKLQSLQDILEELGRVDLNIELDNDSLTDAVTKAGLINDLIESLKKALGFTFDTAEIGKFKQTIQGIKEAIKEILSTDFTPRGEDGQRLEMPDWTYTMESDIRQATEKLEKLNSMATQLDNALNFEFDETSFSTFEARVQLMKDTIYKVLTTDFSPMENGEKVKFETWDELTSPIVDAVNKLISLNDMGKQLDTALRFEFEDTAVEDFQETMNKIVSAVGIVNSVNFGSSSGTKSPVVRKQSGDQEVGYNYSESQAIPETDDGVMAGIEEAKLKLESINGLITTIQNVPLLNPDEFEEKIAAVKTCLQYISEFITNEEANKNAETITSSAEAFTTLAAELEKLLPRFTEFGNGFATNIMAKYNTDNPTQQIETDFGTLITTLQGHKETFKSIGSKYTSNLTEGLIKAIRSISTEIDIVVNDLKKGDSITMMAFSSLGTSLGNSLVNGIKSAVEGLSIKLSMTTSTTSTTGTAIAQTTSNSSYAGGRELMAAGGLVPHPDPGFANIVKRVGTDSVPALLTPGEFVQRRSAVSTFGVDFMKRINNLDVQGAFAALTGRFNTQAMLIPAVSSIVNNINHTTNNANRVTQNVVGGNPDYMMKRASRYLR
ncbi:hypothetical protein LI951_07110 [Enterococcus sp. BWT-B8]|uniref:hypothetical protein n=1 Tax=Enterococcus sp. BWT-B8 TaxID=2885157 RepID=UPI001E559C37|nr:hypothetical protein [Enterococcus sp. BWT-B8]MCB5951829.1 hypothetical protein [Enterococcus sp. BWT-B8]